MMIGNPQSRWKGTFVTKPNSKSVALWALLLPLAGCGESQFRQQIAAMCMEEADPGRDCGCIADRMDAGFPDRLKPAFVALRWPLRPPPQDRDAVNGAMLRQAGIDPADRQQMASANREFRDTYYPLRDEIHRQCGGSL